MKFTTSLIDSYLDFSNFYIYKSFTAMKLINTRLKNKMKDEFLAESMAIYIEKEIAEMFSSYLIIDYFKILKEHIISL